MPWPVAFREMCISAQANRQPSASPLLIVAGAAGVGQRPLSQDVVAQRVPHSGASSDCRPAPTMKRECVMTPSDPYERITQGMVVLDLAGDRIGKVRGVSGRLPDLYRTGDLDAIGRNQEAV